MYWIQESLPAWFRGAERRMLCSLNAVRLAGLEHICTTCKGSLSLSSLRLQSDKHSEPVWMLFPTGFKRLVLTATSGLYAWLVCSSHPCPSPVHAGTVQIDTWKVEPYWATGFNPQLLEVWLVHSASQPAGKFTSLPFQFLHHFKKSPECWVCKYLPTQSVKHWTKIMSFLSLLAGVGQRLRLAIRPQEGYAPYQRITELCVAEGSVSCQCRAALPPLPSVRPTVGSAHSWDGIWGGGGCLIMVLHCWLAKSVIWSHPK